MDGRALPALTLWQPFATLIAIGAKPFETRKRRVPEHMLGQRVAIHAAARTPRGEDFNRAIDDAIQRAKPDLISQREQSRKRVRWFGFLPLGAIVCTATLAECLEAETVPADAFGNYRPGRFGWRLIDVRPLALPEPAKGEQRYGWTWDVQEGIEL